MERLNALVCLGFICVASIQAAIDPRGARPVEHGTRSEKCASQREWPFCTTDEWGSKCPSGCRIQGLMDKYDHNMLKRIEKIRNLLDQYKAKHRSADTVSKQTYDYLKDKLTIESGGDNSYYDLAQNLRQRITDLKIKIDRQLRILAALKDRVKDQVVEMQRLEVDIDIKLRSCKGSCSTYTEYQVDQESYVTLEKQVSQLDSHSPQRIESVGTLYVMKSRPLKEAIVDSIYKSSHGSVAAQKREDVFPEVETVQLILEQEGSVTSPATISKDPGTSYSAATSSTSSSTFGGSSSSSSSTSSSTSSKSITELGGRGDGDLFSGGFDAFGQPSTHHVSSKTLTCTKSTRRVIVHTKEGPVERTEEVMEGGPECQAMADNSRGGMSSLFPSLGHASSSSSTSSSSSSTLTSKTVHTGGTKGSITGVSKGGFGDPFGTGFGFDLGPFHTAAAEDDIPDFHARSVKSTRFERQADYVGKVCVRLKQQHKDGRQSLSHTRTHRKQCRAKSDVPLCSDDDWVSKCPSGCRLQGLISQMESEVEGKLWKVCKTAKIYEDAADKSMTVMTHIYNSNRRVIVNRYMSELKFVERAEGLAGNLTSLRKRSSSLSQRLKELHGNIQEQIDDLYRAEVDIDMKLRACHGSCRSALPFTVNHPSYEMLQIDMDKINNNLNQRSKGTTHPKDIPRVTLQPVDVGPAPSAEYKTIPTVQRELLTQFEDIGQNQLVLEELLEDSADVDVDNYVDLE
ncbi:fibrinogen alpha chain isoform X1 [Seriola lalandi dorsalis]|uniref:Fibrinogen alpha chain n=2 Tax=Seriola TaxID=8160 RepID=A0A3B4YJW5_SERLL|nr:fibrinogen alpha chain isoform X1 [Seriola lalandi dorsalis]